MKRHWYKGGLGPYFLTNTVVGWENVFVNAAFNCLLFDLFSYFRFQHKITIYAYVFMVNHIHYIISFEDKSYSLSDFARDFKSTLTKRIYQRLLLMINENSIPLDNIYMKSGIGIKSALNLVRILEDEGKKVGQHIKLWQNNEKPIFLDSERMAIQRFNYLHENPVRKGWVSTPEEYPYSSAIFYSSGNVFPFRVTNLFE